MKVAFIVFGLVAFIAVFALATVRALTSGQAWVPFTTGVDEGRQVRRDSRPVIFWMLTFTHAAIAVGASGVLVRVMIIHAIT